MKSNSDSDHSRISVPMSGRAGSTPYYVLLDGDRRIGPDVVRSESGPECLAMYGFSNKQAYDRFRRDGRLELAPYPLVKGYLREPVDAAGDGLRLVVVDAAGPFDTHLKAATMKAVLQAQESQTANVVAAYRLTFDPAVKAYRIGTPDV